MLKVRLNCPVCGEQLGARSLDGHLENVHELTGTVTLRLHPTNSYTHEPELVPVPEPPQEPEPGQEPEPEPET
ncbi:hypothetical protein ES703_116251 [subsurface metagenome]